MQKFTIYQPVCSGCGGTGTMPGAIPSEPGQTCPMCGGSGKQVAAHLELDPGLDEIMSDVTQLLVQSVDILSDTAALITQGIQIDDGQTTLLNELQIVADSNAQIIASNAQILQKVFPSGDKVVRTYLIFEATVLSEWQALSAENKEIYRIIIATSIVDLTDGTKARQALINMFGAGSQTIANLKTLLGE